VKLFIKAACAAAVAATMFTALPAEAHACKAGWRPSHGRCARTVYYTPGHHRRVHYVRHYAPVYYDDSYDEPAYYPQPQYVPLPVPLFGFGWGGGGWGGGHHWRR